MDPSLDSISSTIPTSFITLTTKPSAKLSYSFVPAAGSDHQPLLVFLTGLGLPASSWIPTIASLASMTPHPPMLSYDRYGQGLSTDRDPLDAKAEDPEHGHDCMDVVQDLKQLISQICSEKNLKVPGSSENRSEVVEPPILFVANSLGGAVARLYADQYPFTVSAILFLDSVMADCDFVSIWPDPDADGFAEKNLPLPEGVTEEGLRETRARYRKVFHPVTGIMGKAEGLSRKNLAELLPDSDKPVLRFREDGMGPWVTVVGHGFDTFAKEGLKVGLCYRFLYMKLIISRVWGHLLQLRKPILILIGIGIMRDWQRSQVRTEVRDQSKRRSADILSSEMILTLWLVR
jgi:pimeloyl-ACP methyl ester carboxylesterase